MDVAREPVLPTPDQPVTRTVLLDATFAVPHVTARVEVREIRMAPGLAAGLHVHNAPVVGSIVAGSVTYQVDGEPAAVLRAGDVFHEPSGARIARFDAGDDGVVFLGYFLLAAGQEPQITFPDVAAP